MPLTPFAGISVIIHLCVITVHKIFGIDRQQKPDDKKTTTPMFLWSMCIIGLVFLFVLANASFLVYKSLDNTHSSLTLVNTYLNHPVDAPETFHSINPETFYNQSISKDLTIEKTPPMPAQIQDELPAAAGLSLALYKNIFAYPYRE